MSTKQVFVMILHSIEVEVGGFKEDIKKAKNRETMSTAVLHVERGRGLSLKGSQHSLGPTVSQALYLCYFIPFSPISNEMI